MAEYIKRQDDLNTGREIINEELTKSNNNADKAKIDSSEALNIANQSIHQSQSTQDQLNQVIIDGDSSVEAAAARVDEDNITHTTLKERIDDGFTKTKTQLAKTVKKDETGVFDLNIFDEPTRLVIQGLEPGQINAVLGKKNVKEINLDDNVVTPKKTTFMTEYNLFDDSTSLHGGFWQTSDGTWQVRAGVSQSEKYPIKAGDKILFNQLSPEGNNVIQFWDANGDYIRNHLRVLVYADIPPTAVSFSFSYHDSEKEVLEVYVNKTKLPTLKGVDILGSFSEQDLASLTNNPWFNKKIIYQGDSITDPNYNATLTSFYPEIVNTNLSLEQTANYGISGSTIAVNPNNPTERHPIVTRYSSMSNDADLIIIAAGTNDWFYNWSPLGTMESREDTTFYGALHTLCLGLLKKYKGKTILFSTPIMRRQSPYSDPDAKNSLGKTLKEYGDIIKEVCAYYSIPVLDMYKESGLFPFDDELAIEYYNQQGSGDFYYTHPNSNGHEMMAKRMTGFIRGLA